MPFFSRFCTFNFDLSGTFLYSCSLFTTLPSWSRKSCRLRVCICIFMCISNHVCICICILCVFLIVFAFVFVFVSTLPFWWRKWGKRKVSPRCGLACARSASPGKLWLICRILIDCISTSICDILNSSSIWNADLVEVLLITESAGVHKAALVPVLTMLQRLVVPVLLPTH